MGDAEWREAREVRRLRARAAPPVRVDDWSRAVVRLERRPRRGAGDARRGARVRSPGLRARHREERGPGPDGHRRVGQAVTATGRRASRRGAPGPQGALRPLGPQGGPRSRFARPKRSLGVAFRPLSAHAADGPRTATLGGSQRSPPFRRVARRRLSLRAPERSLRVAFGSPPLTIPMGWQDMDSVARNHLAAFLGGWRAARHGSLPPVMDRSLQLSPIIMPTPVARDDAGVVRFSLVAKTSRTCRASPSP